MAKTWRQKHDGHKQEAQIERLPRRYAGLSAGSTIVIASPQEISAYFRSVPKGRTRTINQLRDTLAKRHGADAACPMTTGIFCRIAAEAALETIQHGAKWNQVPPFWRVIDPGSPLAKKLSCGPDFIRQRREEEGITDRVMLGTVCGVLLGLLAVGMMLPMSFPDKRAALIGAFLNRLSIGVSIGLGAASVSLPGWAVGLGLRSRLNISLDRLRNPRQLNSSGRGNARLVRRRPCPRTGLTAHTAHTHRRGRQEPLYL